MALRPIRFPPSHPPPRALHTGSAGGKSRAAPSTAVTLSSDDESAEHAPAPGSDDDDWDDEDGIDPLFDRLDDGSDEGAEDDEDDRDDDMVR